MQGKLVGVHKVTIRKKGQEPLVYYYAWRGKGAPRKMAKPGTKAFTKKYIRLTKDWQKEANAGTIGSLVDEFLQSPHFTRLPRRHAATMNDSLERSGRSSRRSRSERWKPAAAGRSS
ncbi:hypothetical protein ABID21_001349 [Pseudorhizobium tarimense]|uniref:Arm DNA-binding domain-containing protein n=1 Tax=Pseudorhizobium tarimense TaxID=1079109 RepID=A0ABV2H4R3_9HYPH